MRKVAYLVLIKSECRFFQKPVSFSEECVRIVIGDVLGRTYKDIQDSKQLLILGPCFLLASW